MRDEKRMENLLHPPKNPQTKLPRTFPPLPSFNTTSHRPLPSSTTHTMKIISSLKPPFFGSSSSSKKSKTRTRTRTRASAQQPATDQTLLSFTSSSSSSGSLTNPSPNSVLLPPKISRCHLERVLRRLGPDPPTDEEVMTMLAEADGDGDGCISLEEIAALGQAPLMGEEAAAELGATFRVFDADGDGKISAEELMGLFVMLGDEDCTIEDCRRMIRVVDSDGDGFVCFEDFVRMMMGMQR